MYVVDDPDLKTTHSPKQNRVLGIWGLFVSWISRCTNVMANKSRLRDFYVLL